MSGVAPRRRLGSLAPCLSGDRIRHLRDSGFHPRGFGERRDVPRVMDGRRCHRLWSVESGHAQHQDADSGMPSLTASFAVALELAARCPKQSGAEVAYYTQIYPKPRVRPPTDDVQVRLN